MFQLRVNFLIVGTQKGGTTALSTFLRGHPEICFSNQREVHFFDNDGLFKSGKPPYDTYHQCFMEPEKYIAVGENTPVYMYWKPAAKRIYEYNPNMKLIFVLRNPIDRAYSAYQMEKQRDMEKNTFSDAIRRESVRSAVNAPMQHRVYSYCDRGFYSRQIERMMSFFPRNNMCFVKNEALRNQHAATLFKIYKFLGVNTSFVPEPKVVFAHKYEKMSIEDRGYLRRKYLHEIRNLEELLDWDCSAWLS